MSRYKKSRRGWKAKNRHVQYAVSFQMHSITSNCRIPPFSFVITANKKIRLVFAIICLLLAINALSGTFVVMTYAHFIYGKMGSAVSKNVAAIGTAFAILSSLFITSHLMTRLDRKEILLASCAGSSFFAVLLIFFNMSERIGQTYVVHLLSVVCLILYVTMTSIGIVPIPYQMIADLLPAEVIL